MNFSSKSSPLQEIIILFDKLKSLLTKSMEIHQELVAMYNEESKKPDNLNSFIIKEFKKTIISNLIDISGEMMKRQLSILTLAYENLLKAGINITEHVNSSGGST